MTGALMDHSSPYLVLDLLLVVLAGTALPRYVGVLVMVCWCLGGNSRRLALLGYAGSVLEFWIDLASRSGTDVRLALPLVRHTFGQWSEWAEDGIRPSHIG